MTNPQTYVCQIGFGISSVIYMSFASCYAKHNPNGMLDPSAADFRRLQPAPCRAAAAGKNSARRHASRNLLKPPPQFLQRKWF